MNALDDARRRVHLSNASLLTALLSASPLGWPCAWVGDPPDRGEIYAHPYRALDRNDEVFRGRVIVAGSDTRIEVLETFKGTFTPGEIVVYRPFSDCEETYEVDGEERVFFGWRFRGEVQFSQAVGSLESSDPEFKHVLKKLRRKRAK